MRRSRCSDSAPGQGGGVMTTCPICQAAGWALIGAAASVGIEQGKTTAAVIAEYHRSHARSRCSDSAPGQDVAS
jgi:hypothetical protein